VDASAVSILNPLPGIRKELGFLFVVGLFALRQSEFTMDFERITKYLEKWDKIIALLAAVGALLSGALNNPILAYLLAFFGWFMLSSWLWRIARQWEPIQKFVPVFSTKAQKWAALAALIALIVVNIVFLSVLIENLIPKPKTALTPFSEDKFGIIVAEFTQGAEDRATFSGSADKRDAICIDLQHLIDKQELTNKVLVQPAGPVKDEKQAKEWLDKYQADLIVWGYVPIDRPDSIRPTFTVREQELGVVESDPFASIDIVGEDANTLLTNRVAAVSNYLIGVYYLNSASYSNSKGEFSLAETLFSHAINEAEAEINQSGNTLELADGLALLYLMRGKAYAALNQSDKALQDYEKALENYPDWVKVYMAIGNVYYNRRDFDTAQTYFEKAQYTWRGLYGLGLIAYHRGDYALALENFMLALEDAQNSASDHEVVKIRFVLGMTYKQLGDWEQTQAFLGAVCSADNVPKNIQSGACSELTPLPTNTVTMAVLNTSTPIPTITDLPTMLPSATDSPAPSLTLLPTNKPVSKSATVLPTAPTPSASLTPTRTKRPYYTNTPTKKEEPLLPTATLLPVIEETRTEQPPLLPTAYPPPQP
jgi:hypothetical protein